MAPRQENDEPGRTELTNSDDGNGRLLGRRGYMRAAGTALAAAAGLGAASGGAAAAEYRTVTVPAGGRRSFSVGSGETMENVLIDVTAPGADAHITASGSNWTVRNVGVKGAFDVGAGSGGASNVLSVNGDGVVENVYLGDGHENGVRKGAIGCGPTHAGHVEIRNTHVQRWTGNAVYAAGPGRVNPPGKTDGHGGTLAFRDCYFANNNIAHLRIASGGSVVEGCVFTNTNDVPPHPNTSAGDSGVVNSRGIYTGYGDPSQTITVRDCDFDITSANTNGGASAVVSGSHGTYGELTTVRLVDCQVRGRLIGGQVVTENVGNDPDVSIPAGTPADAAGAASGDPQGGDGGSGGGSGDDGKSWTAISVSGGSASNVLSYAFEATGEVEKTTARGGSISDEDEIDGGSVTGAIAGGVDSFRFTGDLAAFDADDGATVHLDGEAVDPSSLGSGSDSPRTLTIQGGSPSNVVSYAFRVSGGAERSDANGATIDPEDVVFGTSVTGAVAGGADSFRVNGEITAFDADGDVAIRWGGEEVSADELDGN